MRKILTAFATLRRVRVEREFVLLTLVVLAIYFTRLSALPCSLDEPLWATIAQEMIYTGNFIVPQQHGIVFPDRPPAHSWLIAASILITDDPSSAAPRIPSAVAVLLTALLIYGFSRTMLPPPGAMAAGLAYATMWETLVKGSTADSDAVFTFFVAASLLFWIWGYTKKWHPAVIWTTGYIFAAAAGLTKGIQGPCFFAGPVIVFLVLRRDWKFLFSRFHALGLALFAVAFGGWLVAFYFRTDLLAVREIFVNIIGQRMNEASWGKVFKHLVVYPWDVCAMMLPWSLLFPLLARREFRQTLDGVRVEVLFLSVSLLVCFVPVWLPPGSHGRYFLPLFPCAAVLFGIVMDRAVSSAEGTRISRFSRLLVAYAAGAMILAAATVLVASWWKEDSIIAQSKGFAVFYLVFATATATLLLHTRNHAAARRAHWGALAVAIFVGMSFTGVLTNTYVRYKVDVQSAVIAAKQALPQNARLVCLGYLHPVFVYYFARPIAAKPWPTRPGDVAPETEFFCFSADQHPDQILPFSWEKIATVRCDRGWRTPSSRSVVIGRRIGEIPTQ